MPLKYVNFNHFLAVTGFLIIIIWLIVLALNDIEPGLTREALEQVSTTLSVVGVMWFIFARWGWRLSFFQGWLVPFPDLEGTWSGSIESSFIRNNEEGRIQPVTCELVIEQTFLDIRCNLKSGESSSHSYGTSLYIDDSSGKKYLIYTYFNRPSIHKRPGSQMHDGTVRLEICDGNKTLKGEYWTNRQTHGEMLFHRVP